jgi:hypothetical protein
MAPSFLAAARAVTVGLVDRTGDLVCEVYHGLRDAQDVSLRARRPRSFDHAVGDVVANE